MLGSILSIFSGVRHQNFGMINNYESFRKCNFIIINLRLTPQFCHIRVSHFQFYLFANTMFLLQNTTLNFKGTPKKTKKNYKFW